MLFDAHVQEIEARLYQQWLVLYARMDKTSFVSFDRFKKMDARATDDSKLSAKQAIEKAEKIKAADQRGEK